MKVGYIYRNVKNFVKCEAFQPFYETDFIRLNI